MTSRRTWSIWGFLLPFGALVHAVILGRHSAIVGVLRRNWTTLSVACRLHLHSGIVFTTQNFLLRASSCSLLQHVVWVAHCHKVLLRLSHIMLPLLRLLKVLHPDILHHLLTHLVLTLLGKQKFSCRIVRSRPFRRITGVFRIVR